MIVRAPPEAILIAHAEVMAADLSNARPFSWAFLGPSEAALGGSEPGDDRVSHASGGTLDLENYGAG